MRFRRGLFGLLLVLVLSLFASPPGFALDSVAFGETSIESTFALDLDASDALNTLVDHELLVSLDDKTEVESLERLGSADESAGYVHADLDAGSTPCARGVPRTFEV